MGSADLVPGVSGGTIALVLGIYERLVTSISEGSSALGAAIKGDFGGFRSHLSRVEWLFLLPLLAGILTAVVALASLLDHQLEERPTVLAGLFFGLVVGSVLIGWRLIRDPRPSHGLIALVVAVGLFLMLGIGEDATVQDPSLLVYFASGAVAICAMILPGISGSLILLLLGMYAAVLDAVDSRDLVVVGVFLVGAIVGLGLFSQLLNWALRKHHDVILAGLIGLMAGSLRVLWPWPNGVDSAALGGPGSDWGVVTVAGLIGFAAVFAISRLAEREEEELSLPQPSG